MKTRIFTAALVFCITLNGFAQKKEDDNKPCTRGQLAQLIVDTLPWVKEFPDVTKKEVKFNDVDSTHPNYEAIKSLVTKGIFVVFQQLFRPNALFQRYELAAYMQIILEKIEKSFEIEFPEDKNLSPLSLYADLPWSGWAYTYVVKATLTGIMMGYPDGTFKGPNLATIKEVKLVLQRIKEKTEALLKEKEAQNKPSIEPSNP